MDFFTAVSGKCSLKNMRAYPWSQLRVLKIIYPYGHNIIAFFYRTGYIDRKTGVTAFGSPTFLSFIKTSACWKTASNSKKNRLC